MNSLRCLTLFICEFEVRMKPIVLLTRHHANTRHRNAPPMLQQEPNRFSIETPSAPSLEQAPYKRVEFRSSDRRVYGRQQQHLSSKSPELYWLQCRRFPIAGLES